MRRLLAAAALLLLTACSVPGLGGEDEAAPSADPTTAAPTVSATPAPEPPEPEDGACYRLAYRDAVAPTTRRKPVPCSGEFTARTFHVGTLDTVVDGHLVAVDSARVRRQLAQECPRRFVEFVGGDARTRRLSMLSTVWFSPTLKQADAGQNWYRCDVVAVESEGRLAPLEDGLRGVLGRDGGLDSWGICGTAEPGAAGFERVICGSRHSWQAVATIDIAGKALPKEAPAAVEDGCRDTARDRADDALSFDWGFEMPTKRQWADGRRYALCWAPSD